RGRTPGGRALARPVPIRPARRHGRRGQRGRAGPGVPPRRPRRPGRPDAGHRDDLAPRAVEPMMDLATARAAGYAFVHGEAGCAQVTTIDADGFPVSRTMTAFLEPDWSVSLVQRAGHRRLAQWRRDPRTLVSWVGPPAPDASNERPHVFDIGQ